jgi:hypothetical protein
MFILLKIIRLDFYVIMFFYLLKMDQYVLNELIQKFKKTEIFNFWLEPFYTYLNW